MTLTILESEPPGVGVIELLDALMERAAANELSSIAIAVVERDGSASQVWSHACSGAALIGSVAMLLHMLMAEEVE